MRIQISISMGLMDMWLVPSKPLLKDLKALAQMIPTVQNLTQNLMHAMFYLISWVKRLFESNSGSFDSLC